MTHQELWQAVLGEVELVISKANFNTWFRNTTILSNENGQVVIGVPSGWAKEWLENRYNHHILQALQRHVPTAKEIICLIQAPANNVNSSAASRTLDAVRPKESASSSASLQGKAGHQAFSRHTMLTSSRPPINLNARYTFDNFIVGENNELAQAACYAVSQNPGLAYNPLFIYGGVGLGKTHLLQAIGHESARLFPEQRLHYTSSERFTNDLIEAIKHKTVSQFKNLHCGMDILIIDDVQDLSGREKTQEEFFNIFNALYQANKQIVISSDRPPKAIPTLEDRLRSRFESGMIADIGRPNLETRLAILKWKMQEKALALDEASLQFIAENMTNNIRELEGALNRVVAACEFQKITPSLPWTQKILSPLITQTKQTLTKDIITQTVADYYHTESEELIKKSRKREIVRPRQMAMYLMREELKTPLVAIGKHFGGKDHTTILHACEKITRDIHQDINIKEDLIQIRERLYQVPENASPAPM